MNEYYLPILPTTVIGSYPRPRWLREIIRRYKKGRVKEKTIKEAYNDAVIAVLKDQEIAGIDIPSDGEQRRDEMVEYFAERINGFKFYGPVRVWGNAFFNKPAVIDELQYKQPIVVDEYNFLKKVSYSEIVKVTITGPYTIADWSFNEYYDSKEELTLALADIINREIKELEKAGAKYVQVDEPALPTHEEEIEWAIEAINNAVKGVNIKLGMHVCYGKYERILPYVDKINVSQFALEFANRGFKDIELLKEYGYDKELGFGVIDVHNRRIESPFEVAEAIRKVLSILPPEKIYINPDCGLKLLPREIARKKMENMVFGTKLVRKELVKAGFDDMILFK